MIKLEFDGQDPIALKHLGQALVNMANELNGGTIEKLMSYNMKDVEVAKQCLDDHKITDDEFEELVKLEAVESNPKYDANGLPWDERIHSGGKTRNADDTWQKRKHNKKDFPSKDDWINYIAEVETELQALMSIPVVEAKQDESMEHTEFDEQKFAEAMEIVNAEELERAELEQQAREASDAQADAPPPPPPLEQVSDPKSETINQDAPPPPPLEVTSVADAGNTPDDVDVSVKFGDITKFITGTIVKNGVKSMSQVTAAITAEYGVAFPLLAKNPKLWPQVMTFLEKMNNEVDTK